MGSVLAMVAVVTVVAGIVTVTTKQLHGVFSGGTPKDGKLHDLLVAWRSDLQPQREQLIVLKQEELDLLAQKPDTTARLLKARNRITGFLQTIYQENIAVFVRQSFPKASIPTELLLIQTKTNEDIYRQQGDQVFISINGTPEGILLRDEFIPAGAAQPTLKLVAQSDRRTVHLDAGERTLAILLIPEASRQVVPRAFEFVDLQNQGDRMMLEALSFYYLVSQNLAG